MEGPLEVPLTSVRLVLRDFTWDDLEDVHEWGADPEVSRYEAWGPNTIDDTRAFVERVLAATALRPRTEHTLLTAIRETGRAIGAGVLYLRSEENRAGEIGYILKRNYWGQGFGTEIAQTLLEFGFERFGLHRIYATCDPRNVRSARILRKIGMVHEGRRREDLLIRDGWRDSDLYAILESEWRSLRQT